MEYKDMSKRVAILTGGGDVPGLNMCLKSLVYRIHDLGFEPIGVRKGWEGLIHYNPHDPTTYSEYFIELTKNMVRPIDRTPGSFLHSSRRDPEHYPTPLAPDFLRKTKAETQDMTAHIKDVVKRLEYRALIVIGDDDMIHFAARLSQEGVPIIAIPKTIHGNIRGTDYTLGFSTGLARGVAFIHDLRALAGSREQIIVLETFKADSGYSTLLMALLAGVDRVIIPEVAYNPEKLAHLTLLDKQQTPSNYAVVLVCNGSTLEPEVANKYTDIITQNGQADQRLIGSGMIAAELLSHITGEEVFLQPLTYLLRTGLPDGQDLLGATNFAFIAARLVAEGKFGRMATFVQEKMWTDIDITVAREGVKTVDIEAWYDSENYKPKLSLIWSDQNL
jgi:6-phosphofructokinase 1